MIQEEIAESVLRVDHVKTPLSVVLKRLEQFGFLAGIHDDCVVCEYDPDNCNKLRGCVQELMDQGLLQFSKSKAVEEVVVIEPIIIVHRKKKVEAPPRGFSQSISEFLVRFRIIISRRCLRIMRQQRIWVEKKFVFLTPKSST